MSDYKRRNINIDKLSSYIRKTGICTEEAALHLMDEIMFLRADSSANCVTHGKQSIGLCAACQKVEKEALRGTIKRLTEMVGAAYTAGWMAGYSSAPLDDETEANKDFHCGEDWLERDLRRELLEIMDRA
jgi:hypothetical protein